MGNFNRGGGGGPRRDFGGRDSGRSGFGDRGGGFDRGGNRGGGMREMFKAVCSNCGKDCQVPFRPTGSKPVYCSDCFEKQGGGNRENTFQDRAPRRDNFERRNESQPQNNAQIEAISRKLDKILDLLTKTQSTPENIKQVPEVKEEVRPVEEKVTTPKKAKALKKKASVKKE